MESPHDFCAVHRDLEPIRPRERRRPRRRDAHVQPAGRDAGAPRFMESIHFFLKCIAIRNRIVLVLVLEDKPSNRGRGRERRRERDVGSWKMSCYQSLSLFCTLALTTCSRRNLDSGSPAHNGASNLPPRGAQQAVIQIIDGVTLHPGRRRDAILPIDHPMFGAHEPDGAELLGEDLVVGVYFGGIARAYPLWILGTREIVNDRFENDTVCVTYCPLSASAVAFLSQVGSRPLTFGNEGALYECNLVLYDRQTYSLWYQLRGCAIAGDYKNARLRIVPAVVARWADWRTRYPSSTILVGDQQSGRFFKTQDVAAPALPDPAGPMAPVSRMDPRLAPMQRVIGFHYQGRDLCLPVTLVDQLAGGRVAIAGTQGAFIARQADGILDVVGPDGSGLTTVGGYWFAWHAAFPAGDVITNRSR